MKALILSVLLSLTATPVYANTVTGQFMLVSERFWRDGDRCEGIRGYSDINSGTPIIVRDENNNIIANGELGIGILEDRVTCVYPIIAFELPKAKYYQFEIGKRDITYSREQLLKNGFKLELFLGG
ncbi:hypothetical protein [Crocosphaera sp.]|uniref:hypothetical protein n=1 Tax=Crocosphaera sp. TaxID=2729996 RepID=UPI0026110B5D|nr:hypothetical protein [Crocosphaera sp.]MDJ0579049.1 hypothetical protein [Crocosphaera sp.]